MQATDLGAIAYALALAFAAWVTLDLGRRWIAYRHATLNDSAAMQALTQRCEIADKAIVKMAKDLATALDVERKRLTALESKMVATNVSRGGRAPAWEKP